MPEYTGSPCFPVKAGDLSPGGQGSNLFFRSSVQGMSRNRPLWRPTAFCTRENIFDTISVATMIANRMAYSSELLTLEGKIIERGVK